MMSGIVYLQADEEIQEKFIFAQHVSNWNPLARTQHKQNQH